MRVSSKNYHELLCDYVTLVNLGNFLLLLDARLGMELAGVPWPKPNMFK